MASQSQTRQQGSERTQGAPQAQTGGSQEMQRSRGRGQQGTELQTRGTSAPSMYYGEGPFSLMRRLSDEMDRLFESFGMGSSLWPQYGRGGTGFGGREDLQTLWSPRLEMCERGNKLCVSVDLPGVKRDDVNVQIDQNAITIQGERRQEQTTDERGYYSSERSYGSFYRQIPLPEGTNPDTASATFRDGVLEIELDAPKQQMQGRKLEIKEGSATTAASGTQGTTASTGPSTGTH